MSLRPIYGHDALLHRLAGALASSRFPQAALFAGPQGVGKQRIALWLAQGLLCERGPGAPCDECGSCRKVRSLGHPDLHWFVPIPHPKAEDPDKQVDEAKERLAEVWAERRAKPLYQRPDGMASHSLASVHLILRVVSITPFQADRKVVVLGDAERLVAQQGSDAAANAFLKVLEEPPADTVLLLTAADPQALLPTIRSRLVPIRVGRVSDDAVRGFLAHELDPVPAEAEIERRVLLADGCIGTALSAEGDGDQAARAAARLLRAVESGPAGWAAAALAQPPWAARGAFTTTLDALAVKLRQGLVDAAGSPENRLDARMKALQRVQETRTEAQGNANPQLALAVLAGDLERLL